MWKLNKLFSLLTFCCQLLRGGALTVNAPTPDAAQWKFTEVGTSGVLALESITLSPTLVMFLSNTFNNPLLINNHSAWGALFNLETNSVIPLDLVSNTFCGAGAFLSNGSMVSIGGSTIGADGDEDGRTAIRVFEPCNNPAGVGCTIFDNPETLHMAVARWYATSVKIFDGSIMIIGGITIPTPFYNDDVNAVNTFEFFPPKDGGVPRPSAFLKRSLPANLFPRAFALPDGKVFMVANNQSIIYDIETQVETKLPDIPNGVRVTNPFDGTGVLLPLSPPDYTPEVLICGGTNISDSVPPMNISSQTPASNQCSRITLTPEGIKRGWEVEHMLEGRMMPETILLPNGQVVIINGAQTGAAAFGGVKDPVDGIGSNADHPAFTPSLYTPSAPLGRRISNRGMPTTNIARLYHSSVTLTGNGNLLIAGNNPNGNVTSAGKFPTELRVETFDPPFMFVQRPSLLRVPSKVGFGQMINIPISIPTNLKATSVQVAFMDLGFSTHAWHSSARLVFLVANLSPNRRTLTITTPPNPRVFPPGPVFLFLTVDDVTSVGAQLMLGSGASPPVSG